MLRPARMLAATRCAPGARSHEGGFSLIELLVALIIIVLITSMVSLAVTSGGQGIRLEATVRGLADVATFALDEAQFNAQDYGLLLREEYTADGELRYTYRWLARGLEGWQEPGGGQEVFRAGAIPAEVSLELEFEDGRLADLAAEDEDGIIVPQVVFYSSGETTAGALNLRNRDSGDLLWRIEWDLLGRFEVLLRGEPEEEEDS